MTKKKVFILGVRCQKGGTSWLYIQLKKSKHVNLGFTKEYHVFDALYVDECRYFFWQTWEKLKILSSKEVGFDQQDSTLLQHAQFYLDTSNYFNYFDYLWYSNSRTTVVGDITPSYSALPVEALRNIRDGLESRGFSVKVIFFMRDPIERCWSMVRMGRNTQLRMYPDQSIEDEEEMLEKMYDSRACEIRTKYETTIRNLESVFRTDDIYYGFYESLFEESSIHELKSFLNIVDFSPDITEYVNVSEKEIKELKFSLAEKIFSHYRGTYEFCDEKFGVRDLWSGWSYENIIASRL